VKFLHKKTLLQDSRFLCQCIAVGFTVVGLNSLVHIFGLPRPVFIASVIIVGMFFCGWGCPFGALQEWTRALGKRMFGIGYNIPNPLHRYLSLSRYILWGLTFFAIWSWQPLNSRRAFLKLTTSHELEIAAALIMAVILLLSLFMDRPYCKYICGFGSEFGLMSLFRVFTFRRSPKKCVSCGKCDQACPMGLEVSTYENLRSASCINCFRCVSACPVKGALTFGPAYVRLQDIKEIKNRWLPSAHTVGSHRETQTNQQSVTAQTKETSV
jgi:Polyferredoxin